MKPLARFSDALSARVAKIKLKQLQSIGKLLANDPLEALERKFRLDFFLNVFSDQLVMRSTSESKYSATAIS